MMTLLAAVRNRFQEDKAEFTIEQRISLLLNKRKSYQNIKIIRIVKIIEIIISVICHIYIIIFLTVIYIYI